MSLAHWIVVLVIVLLLFGTRRLTSGARDLGKAVNEFKKGVNGDEEATPPPSSKTDDSNSNTPK